jgi:S-adenosylmethionine:tRNA ribosyltransferase-isomerase
MNTDFLDYALPLELIAQQPCPERDQSRLLVTRRAGQSLEHRLFHDLPDLLSSGDLLVLNDTRVLPARLVGWRDRTGGKWEGLFLRQRLDGLWELFARRSYDAAAEGETILVELGPLRLELVVRTAEGHWLARPDQPGTPPELLARHGHLPLPRFIRNGKADGADQECYQTVYARRAGAVAAPTAGLHFTPRLFEALERRGVGRAFVTLHVGLGTFQSIQVADYRKHPMHREWGELPAGTVDAIHACKDRGGRVVAVGTTSVRVLETVAALGPLRAWSGETELFIHLPYQFRAVDALVTNFHLHRTTLRLLVAAFAGTELTYRAYQTAVEQRYRFYSYGDAMLIL